MVFQVILNVEYAGECKLITVSKESSYDQFFRSVIQSWNRLQGNIENISLFWSVGSIKKCILQSSNDLQNLVSYSELNSHKFVQVCVCDSVNCVVRTTNSVSRHFGDPLTISPPPILSSSQPIDHSSITNQGDQFPFRSKKKSKTSSSQPQKDFESICNIPSYDICPPVPRKSLLSDAWADTMKDGVGMEFRGGVVEFRKEIIKYSTQKGFNFSYLRNDAKYINIICSEAHTCHCPWFVSGKCQSVTKYFVITKANWVHECTHILINDDTKRLSPKIMSELVLQKVRTKPNISAKEIVDLLNDDYGFKIAYWKAWRIVESAREQIFGSYDESYHQLKWYCAAIEHTNPGSAVLFEVNNRSNRFERLFISFKACLDGFKSCRPMLFIDGTFMKGRSKGILLSATAKDGNNGLFPIAFAVVSAENIHNWVWFLEKCRDYIKHDKPLLYISDRHVGLMAAFPIVFQAPVHFFCLFHLITNLKGKFGKGWNNSQRSNMADHFRAVAYAPNIRLFEEKLAIFKEVGGKIAEQWLEDLPYEKWAVSHSPNICRYGEMTSNAAESFNSWISNLRSMPITHMIDGIRKGISRWILERREQSLNWTGALCPKKEEWWNHLINKGRTWKVIPSSAGDFEVISTPSVRVDLRTRECSCCQWKVRGFPCSHAVAVIRQNSPSVFTYVDSCFFTSHFRKSYSFDIHPIPGTEEYECISNVDEKKLLPPLLKRPPGRPKKKRVPSFGESRKNLVRFCQKCQEFGRHDPFTCLQNCT